MVYIIVMIGYYCYDWLLLVVYIYYCYWILLDGLYYCYWMVYIIVIEWFILLL